MSFLLKITQSYFSYLTIIWHFSILPNGENFNFFIKFLRTCDTSIKVFCEMVKKNPKSNGIFLILPLVKVNVLAGGSPCGVSTLLMRSQHECHLHLIVWLRSMVLRAQVRAAHLCSTNVEPPGRLSSTVPILIIA